MARRTGFGKLAALALIGAATLPAVFCTSVALAQQVNPQTQNQARDAQAQPSRVPNANTAARKIFMGSGTP